VGHLYAQAGAPGLRAALKAVADGTDARQAVAAAAGVTWPEFERGWRAYMVAQKYRTFPAIDIPTTHIRKQSAIASSRKPSEDEVLSASAKMAPPFRFLRLGNMFLRRNRPRAAVAEYEKGAKATLATASRRGGDPAAGWLFPVKLGRTYLVLGEPERALKALGAVEAAYPDLPWPHVIAGQALLAKGAPADAVPELISALATNPFDPEVHCALADAYAKVPSAATGGPPAELMTREQKFCKELAGPAE
jgi:tetratricopeptide (TPR) repeat protein